jgi:dihydroorotase
MNILIKSATILDAESPFNKSTQDILIENNRITKIDQSIENPNNYQEISLNKLHISQGWFDSSVSFGEPGFEERETLSNGLKTAALSGFTAIALNANTDPVRDSGSEVAYLNAKTGGHAVIVIPIGALTKNKNGKDLAELFDMHTEGAKAFYDYQSAIDNPNLIKLALQYADGFGGLVCSFPNTKSIAGIGTLNEHIMSTRLGLKGIPNLAEELQVARDLFILEYTGGKLHIPTISSAKSVALIRDAKAKNLDVSCSVAIHNLIFSDDILHDFDTKFKVMPPLRTEADIKALLEGVKDGTIDMVTTDHNPLNIELKKVEFEHAAYGTIGLEAAFGALNGILPTGEAIQFLTQGKARFGAASQPIAVGSEVNLSLFNPDKTYKLTTEHLHSKSKNCIYEGMELKGKVYGVIANGQVQLNTKI